MTAYIKDTQSEISKKVIKPVKIKNSETKETKKTKK